MKESRNGNAVVLRGTVRDRAVERSRSESQLKLMTERHVTATLDRQRAQMWARRKKRQEAAGVPPVEEEPAGPSDEDLAAHEERCRQRRQERRRRKKLQMRKDKANAGPQVEHVDYAAAAGAAQKGEPEEPDSEEEFDKLLPQKGEFQTCMDLALRHHVDISYVRECLQDFRKVDKDRNGVITFEEFKDVLANRCNLAPGQDVPKHLLWKQWQKIDADCSSTIDFEEYLVWCMSSIFSEDLMVPQTEARRIRQLARELDVSLLQVERVKKVFDKFDADNSGEIDKDEFIQVLCHMMSVKDPSDVSQSMLMRYWREVDCDNSGSVDFEEFLVWYMKMNHGKV